MSAPATPSTQSEPISLLPAAAARGTQRNGTATVEAGVAASEPQPSLAQAGTIRTATLADIPAMQALINGFAQQNRMLFRSRTELTEFIDEYQVCVADGALLGVCGLHAVAGNLAEVRGLAVSLQANGHGIGRALVEACVQRAEDLGIAKVYTLTLVPGFFEKLGFYQVDRGTLHLKVWYECYRCPKFANCDEIAMVRPLDLES